MQDSSAAWFVSVSLLLRLVGGGGADALVTYWLRRRGKVCCVLGPFVRGRLLRDATGAFLTAPEDPDEIARHVQETQDTLEVTYDFDIRFFNEREQGTGL